MHATHARDHEAIVSRLDRISGVVLEIASIDAADQRRAAKAVITAMHFLMAEGAFFFDSAPPALSPLRVISPRGTAHSATQWHSDNHDIMTGAR